MKMGWVRRDLGWLVESTSSKGWIVLFNSIFFLLPPKYLDEILVRTFNFTQQT